MTIRTISIRRHDVSANRRFDEMEFRENDVASKTSLAGFLNEVPQKVLRPF